MQVTSDLITKIDLKDRTPIEFVCSECNKSSSGLYYKNRTMKYGRLLCRNCLKNITNIKKYGCISPLTNVSIIEKTKKTCLEKYGVEHAASSPIVQKKIEETNLKKYGEARPYKIGSDRYIELFFNKYGVNSPIKNDELRLKIEKTCLEKYGVEHAASSPIVQKKIEETNLKKYGCKTPFGSKDIQDKSKQTMKKRYGFEYSLSVPEFKEKSKITKIKLYGNEKYNNNKKTKKTKLERYGDEYYNNIEKIRKTNIERYGYENVFQSQDIQDKSKQTKLKRYGNEYWNNPEKISETLKSRSKEDIDNFTSKFVNTMNERYGVDYPLQSKDIRNKIYKKYIYKDGTSFDSAWELKYYIYHLEKGDDIVREPQPLMYMFHGDTKYLYTDFMVNGELVEIKGDQFIDSDNKFKCPFDTVDGCPSERKEYKTELYKAKQKCLEDNNVKILRRSDLINAFNYFNMMYNVSYLNMFRCVGGLTKYMFSNISSYTEGVTPFNVNCDGSYVKCDTVGVTPFDNYLKC